MNGKSWKKLNERDVEDVLISRDQPSLGSKARNIK